MRIVHEEGDFYAVYDATSSMRKYFQYTVPSSYRRYESDPRPHWVVHSKYLEDIPSTGELQDPWSTMFLTKGAPRFIIDAVWKALAKHHHPDRGGLAADFQRIKKAYEALKNGRDNNRDPP